MIKNIDLNMDSYLILSIINTKLRDFYNNLDDLVEDLNIDKIILIDKLKEIGYLYNNKLNQFIIKDL